MSIEMEETVARQGLAEIEQAIAILASAKNAGLAGVLYKELEHRYFTLAVTGLAEQKMDAVMYFNLLRHSASTYIDAYTRLNKLEPICYSCINLRPLLCALLSGDSELVARVQAVQDKRYEACAGDAERYYLARLLGDLICGERLMLDSLLRDLYAHIDSGRLGFYRLCTALQQNNEAEFDAAYNDIIADYMALTTKRFINERDRRDLEYFYFSVDISFLCLALLCIAKQCGLSLRQNYAVVDAGLLACVLQDEGLTVL